MFLRETHNLALPRQQDQISVPLSANRDGVPVGKMSYWIAIVTLGGFVGMGDKTERLEKSTQGSSIGVGVLGGDDGIPHSLTLYKCTSRPAKAPDQEKPGGNTWQKVPGVTTKSSRIIAFSRSPDAGVRIILGGI